MHALPNLKPTLLIVDGMAIVRRCYKAHKAKGRDEDTVERAEGALAAAFHSFMRALRETEPTHFLAPFDAGGKTFRHDIFPEYKAKREPMASVLSDALPGFIEQLNNSGMRTVSILGVEADDVIGTLARKAALRGFRAVIAASDKDLLKLLAYPDIEIRDHFESAFRDAEWVHNRFGVTPAQMTDYLALMGDDTDGIPGVPQVGEITAARLLTAYGDLESVLEGAERIPGKLGQKLRASGDLARLSRRLVDLRMDVDIGIKPSEMAIPAQLYDAILNNPPPVILRPSPTGAHAISRIAQQQEALTTRRPRPN